MPATAGRVRMPANNRVHSSAALQTHGIWQSAIGYDPYAPSKDEKKGSYEKVDASSSDPKAGENTYASFQGLLALAKVTNSNVDEYRGACKMCGRVGHLTYQCRNFLSIKDNEDRDQEALEARVRSEYDKMKKIRGRVNGGESDEESESESDEESESEDSDYDSDMEREIVKRYGKTAISKLKRKDSDDDRENKKKRGRSRKRRSGKKVDSDSDSEDNGGKTRRKEKRGSDGREGRRGKGSRTSHRRTEDSGKFEDSDEKRNRRAADRDNSRLEESRVGRERKKRPEKKTRNYSYEREDRCAVNMSH